MQRPFQKVRQEPVRSDLSDPIKVTTVVPKIRTTKRIGPQQVEAALHGAVRTTREAKGMANAAAKRAKRQQKRKFLEARARENTGRPK